MSAGPGPNVVYKTEILRAESGEREESVTRAEREWWAVGGLLWAASDTSHCTMGENLGPGGHLAFSP